MAGLAEIPFFGAYAQRTQMNQQQPLQQLQQAQAVMGLQGALQQQAMARQRQADLAGLGPEASPEQIMGVVAKYNPEKAAELQQRSAAQKEAREQSALQFSMNLDMRRDALEQQRELALSRAADKAAQDAINNQFKQRQLALDEQGKKFQQYLAEQGLDIKRLLAEQKKEPKPLTEFQGRNVLFGTRSAQADKLLTSLEEKVSLEGMSLASKVPGGNYLLSSEQQRVRQAQRDFVNAVLRQESGAVISDQEFANAQQQYFPAPGDSKETIAQKRANRKLVIQGFKRLAGPGGNDVQSILDQPLLPNAEQPPEAPAAPAAAPANDPLGIRK